MFGELLNAGASVFGALEQSSNVRNTNAANAQIAREQMQFNAQESQKARDFEQWMSSTAHQREIKDLHDAGLNPILSVMGGSGASTPGGEAASAGGMPTMQTPPSIIQAVQGGVMDAIKLMNETKLANSNIKRNVADAKSQEMHNKIFKEASENILYLMREMKTGWSSIRDAIGHGFKSFGDFLGDDDTKKDYWQPSTGFSTNGGN